MASQHTNAELTPEDAALIEFLHEIPRKVFVPVAAGVLGLGFFLGLRRAVTGKVTNDAYWAAAKAFGLGTAASCGAAYVGVRSTMYALDVHNAKEFGMKMREIVPQRTKKFGLLPAANTEEPNPWEWRFYFPAKSDKEPTE
eukprot:TRINITY_DN1137_c2_g1_i1.p1 TRINITY_DN1137_c2_g1~~TRINITY_DN1137_c2_g1_i1.p1  ORF type:complete len:141 (+),score=10.62 TRINITY_DN1137_c2_g1_i1:53-475(+)